MVVECYPVSMRKNFLLVDDHTLIRSALGFVIKEAYPGSIVEESANSTGIIEKLKKTHFDLIILDINMPDYDPLWFINHINSDYPGTPVLIYSMTAENIYALPALKAGAKGFVLKSSSTAELTIAIDIVLKGKTYISQSVAELLSLGSLKKTGTPFTVLSPREFQIAVLLLAGKTSSVISKLLVLGNSTVGTHKANIFRKLKISNLIELKTISELYRI
jgi:DNA-binding NarL/FixJ family response regulator